MSEYLVALESVRLEDAGRVGSKAAVLGTLKEAGFPVPPGLCLTTVAFHHAFEPHKPQIDVILQTHDLRDPAGSAMAASLIAEALSDLAVPGDVIVELRQMLPALTEAKMPLAVRSSATAEDLAGASFAGQYATVLGVRGAKAIEYAIVECWRSFYTANALAERAKHGAIAGGEGMAVLIQQMVDAECAGICFTVDPVQHHPELIVVDAAWGLGIGAVDGAVATDAVRVRRDGLVVEDQHIVEKDEQIALDPEQGVQRIAVPEERRKAACLPESWLQRVVSFALAAEVLLGKPQDIEWAIADKHVWILQSRPITTLPAELAQVPPFPVQWENERDRFLHWNRSHSSKRSVTMPLEAEVSRLFNDADTDARHIRGAANILLLRIINGREYYGRDTSPLREGDRRVRKAALEDRDIRLREAGTNLWEDAAPEIIAATQRLAAFDLQNADAAKLAEHLEDAFGVFLRHWTLHWLLWSEAPNPFFKAYEKASSLTGREAYEAASKFLEGEETILTKIIDEIYDLAQLARQTPAVAALIAHPTNDSLRRLEELPEAEPFRHRLDEFLKLYGDRNGSGYGSATTFATPTWREDPSIVLAMASSYLAMGDRSPAAAREHARQERDAEFEQFCRSCSDTEAVAELRRWLPYMRKDATGLEEHNHYIDQQAVGQLRAAYMAAARKLVERGVLAEAEEAYWLTRDEIVAALRAETPASLAGTVNERKRQHAEWSELVPPVLLGVPKPELDDRPPLKDEVTEAAAHDANLLKGMGASPGHHRGRARVVAENVILPEVEPGDVLIAENAGPLWTPIFPVLGALVLDEGSLGQHAATTTREYGVPAVIRTKKATRVIPDGAWVIVDGTAGTVEIETGAQR